MKIIRTPGIAREQEYADRGSYAESVLTLDTRLLQDIISGRWTRQQLYGSTPSWYRDSFYNIAQPWDNRPGGYEMPLGSQRPSLMCDHQPRPLPIRSPSEVSSTAERPSTVGPSVSIVEPPSCEKRVNFGISHYASVITTEKHQATKKESLTIQPEDSQKARTTVGTTMTVTPPMMTTPSLRQPEQTTDGLDVVPRSTCPTASTVDSTYPEETIRTDGGRSMFEITSLGVKDMDITTPK